MNEKNINCTAFENSRCIASGTLLEVAKKVKATVDKGNKTPILIFDDITSEFVEIDFRGTMDDVLKWLKESMKASEPDAGTPDKGEQSARGPGRPKLGVVSREVTLLPRHWEWLNSQSGGASVALRKLVDEARHANRDKDRLRQAKEAVYRFMSAMAGNLPGYEEALRALYADKPERFNEQLVLWPEDIRNHTQKISKTAFQV